MPDCRNRLLAGSLGATMAFLVCAPRVAQAQRRCRVADVAVSPSQTSVRVGATYPFTATAYDATGNPCDNITFVWTSSSPALSTIDANGIAHGIAAGSVEIRARTGVGAAARTGTAVLIVEASVATQSDRATSSTIPGYSPVFGRPNGPGYAAFDRQPEGAGPADGLFVDPLQLTLVRGESRALDFRAVRGGDGQNAQRIPIMFSVDPGGERILAVDSFGIVTSLGEAGAATVRLTIPGQQRIQPKLVRVDVRADTLRFNRVDFSMTPGTSETLSVFIPAQSRALNPGGLFQFTSSDPTKVRVNPVNPVIEALAPGVARITAQSSIYPEITATVHVHRRVTSLRLDPPDSVRTLAIGGRTTVRAAALAADNTPVPEAPITWRAPDSAIVFDTATGQVTGRRSGQATILVSVPTIRDEALTRMVRIRVVAGGLSVARQRFGMGVGERLPLEVQLLDDARNTVGLANTYLGWTATPDTVARVDNGNEIVALKPGRVRLTGRATWDSTVALDIFVVGDILVTGQNQGRRDLLVKWNNGQNWSPLTSDSAVELQAAWSQDLTRIAFTARPFSLQPQRVPTAALFLVNADGTGRLRVTDDSSMVRYPSFLPGGQRIVFESNRGVRQPAQIWMVEVRGDTVGVARQLTTATPGVANTAPAVSRDGLRMAYVSFRETGPGRPVYGIYQANIDASEERLKTVAPAGQRLDNPAYSPDGRTLYFLRSDAGRPPAQRVYRLNLEAASDTAVAVTPPGTFVNAFTVSGDGSLLALAITEAAQGNQQGAQRVVLFTIGTGATQAVDTSPEERLASPVLRPATPRPAVAPSH